MPSLSSVRTLSTCCLLVSGFFTEIAQQIHSLRARGVRSSHEALASASEARVFRKSSGNSWTPPPEMSLLVRVIRLSYYKIASLARIAGANGVFNVPVFSRAELTKMVCTCSLVERLDLLPLAVLLMSGGKLPAKTGQIRSLPMKIRILTRFAKQPPWERASPCSREPQVAGQNVVSAARYLVARNSLPLDRCKVAW